MDGDEDNDNDVDEEFDDNLSVVSDDDVHNTDSDVDDDKGSVTKNSIKNNEDGEREDHAHWYNMKWNKTTHTFEYMDDDYDETADGAPIITQWKKVHPWEMTDVRVTFNEGRNIMIRFYVTEYDALHKWLDHLSNEKTPEGVFNYLFGPQSRLAEVMKRMLDISYKEFSQFLSTVYFAAKFGTSTKHLEAHRSIMNDGYMKRDRLNNIWTRISVAGKTGFGKKLWEEIQDALNKTLRDLFLAEGFRPDVMHIAMDGDKVHFHMSTITMQ